MKQRGLSAVLRPGLIATLGLAVLLVACAGAEQRAPAAAPAPAEEEGSLLRGNRAVSPSVRTSENRPLGYQEEKGPFQADRLGIGQAKAREQERHRQVHRQFASRMEAFAHPACELLVAKERQQCPLLSIRWTRVQDIPDGIELEGPRAGLDAQRVRLQLLCHIAYGKTLEEQGCPMQQPSIRAAVLERGNNILVRLTVRPEQQETLRQQVRLAVDLGKNP